MGPYPVAVGADDVAFCDFGSERLRPIGLRQIGDVGDLASEVVEVHDVEGKALAAVGAGLAFRLLNDLLVS